VKTTVSLAETSKILSDTFQQLKASLPIELELKMKSMDGIENRYFIKARTMPSMKKYLDVECYLHKKTVFW
jgi:hypothetical protein